MHPCHKEGHQHFGLHFRKSIGGRWSFYPEPRWDCICSSTVSNSGFHSTRETWTDWSKSSKGALKWRVWYVRHTRSGWESWDFLAWRREGCWGDHIDVYKYLVTGRKMTEVDLPLGLITGYHRQRTRIETRETPLKHKNKLFFHSKRGWILAVESPSLEVLKTWLGTALSNLL